MTSFPITWFIPPFSKKVQVPKRQKQHSLSDKSSERNQMWHRCRKHLNWGTVTNTLI
jgi:hypothetical protein